MQQQIQAWFMGLPLKIKIALIAGIGLGVATAMYGQKVIKALLPYWPVFVVLIIATGVGVFFFLRWQEQKRQARQMEINNELAKQGCVRLVLPPRGGANSWKQTAQQAEAFAASICTAVRQSPDIHLSLEIVGTEHGTIVDVWSPDDIAPTVLQGLMSCFPDAQVRSPQDILKMPDPLAKLDPKTNWTLMALSLASQYPLRQSDEFASESLAYSLAALTRAPGMGRIGVQFIIHSPDDKNLAKGRQDVEKQRAAMTRAKGTRPADRKRLEQLELKADALTGVATTVLAFAEPKSAPRLKRLVSAVTNGSRSKHNSLRVVAEGEGAERITGRHFDYKAGHSTILSAEELAPLWHVPPDTGDVIMARGTFRQPPPEVVVVCGPGEYPFNSKHRIIGRSRMKTGEEVFIRWEYGFDTLVHSFWCGSTGAGKSTTIQNIVKQDVCAGYGVIVQEPHRDLTMEIINDVPPEREQDVIWINPTDPDRSFGINLLDTGGDPALIEGTAATFTTVLQKIIGWDDKVAVRMTRLMNNAVLAVMEAVPTPTMQHLLAFFRYEEYRAKLLESVQNPVIKEFWLTDFPNWGKSEQTGAISPVLNRVEPLLTKVLTRHVIGQAHTTLPMRQIMDAGKVVLVDLAAKDSRVGEKNAEAMGTMVVAMVWGGASSRIKGTYPIPTSYWVDEFQTAVTEDFVSILAEARGFGLGLNLATQYYMRLPKWMQAAVMANCRTKVSGAVESPDEARLMQNLFLVDEEQLRTLEAYTYIARVSAQSRATDSFTLLGFDKYGEKGKLNGETLRAAYMQANGGRLKTPADLGALPFDFFEGVSPLSKSDLAAWQQHKAAKNGLDLAGRAVYLAGLPDDEYQAYKVLRRQVDRARYEEILRKPSRYPEKDKRIRMLSSLQVETPRDEIEADRLKLEAEIKSAVAAVGDMLSGNDLF